MGRKTLLLLVLFFASVIFPGVATAQLDRTVQNRPYIDLRPLHFGIILGINLQDVEFDNVPPQTISYTDELTGEETTQPETILCDADRWDPGFSVGVMGELRLNRFIALRLTPIMYFGSKHLTFQNLSVKDENGKPMTQTQNLKNTYISLPINFKIAAERWNNYRPYVMAGMSHMINLTKKSQDLIQLKRSDTFVEIGMGCDFYLPFFKLVPELKFCYGITDALDHSHVDEMRDETMRKYVTSVNKARTKLIVLTFYFE